MNILVTGGAGYIGSVVTSDLLAKGHTVIVYDNLSHGHKEAVPEGAKLVVGDIGDGDAIRKTLKNHHIDAVMHFAALIEAGESMKDPGRFFQNNTANALTLLNSMQAEGVSKLVFSSTAAVYGNPIKTPIAEDHPLSPTNAYGESKLLVERMLPWFHHAHGLRYAALRYFNAAGGTPQRGEEHQPESHLIPLAIAAVRGDRPPLQLFGTDYKTKDGTCVRDYIHIKDLSSAHLLALDALSRPDTEGQLIYNLGNGEGFTNREVLETIGKVAGKPVPYTDAPRRPGDPAVLIADSTKIQKELGWKTQYPDLESIVQTAWDWREAHPQGYGKER